MLLTDWFDDGAGVADSESSGARVVQRVTGAAWRPWASVQHGENYHAGV